MRNTVIGVTIAIFAAGPALAQPETVEARLADLEEREIAARAALALDAQDVGLLRDAAALAQSILATRPDHPVGELTAGLKDVDGRAFAGTYASALKRAGPAFAKATARAFEPIADELVDLAEAAASADRDELAELAWVRAYRLDPGNGKVIRALKKLDYDAIFNYGVLPKAEKESARKVLRRLRGSFLSKSDLTDELKFWTDAWGLETLHYRFVTNAPHGTVFAFAQACEDLSPAWEEFAKRGRAKLRKLTRPCTIYLFASELDYETILRVRGEEPLDADTVLGFYDPTTKIGYFYDDPGFYGGDLTLLFETFFHEGAHQLFDLRLKGAWRGNAAKHELHWVEEGICCYLESLVVREQGNDRVYELGALIDDDFGGGMESLLAGDLMGAEDFVHATYEVWNGYDDGYPHATLLTHFLIEGEGGRYLPLAWEALLAERTTGGFRKQSLFEKLRMTPEQLEAALRDFANAARAKLPAREYR